MSRPDKTFKRVVFPDPEGPSITKISPSYISKLTPSKALFGILPR